MLRIGIQDYFFLLLGFRYCKNDHHNHQGRQGNYGNEENKESYIVSFSVQNFEILKL